MSGIIGDNTGRGTGLIKAAGGGGKILQAVQTVKTDITNSSSSSYADISGMSRTITPTAASSKILIMIAFSLGNSGGLGVHCQRDVNGGGYNTLTGWTGDAADSNTRTIGGGNYDYDFESFNSQYLDSPSYSLGNVITYKFQWTPNVSGTMQMNRAHATGTQAYRFRGCSTITVMEIGA